ncbi:MAG: histidine--tRNA ligase [Desulfococcus sp.]|nr:MAG: histidine--tRNA ligase [Desulfococcus sp.]
MIQLIRGFKDNLPGESELWQGVEETARALFRDFGFQEIRVPIMEKTELFARGIGEATDIVEKEMYTFTDRGGEMLTLRPEATASVARAYIQHKLYAGDPVRRLFTIGPMFRRERPQKGRYRQFHQINCEAFGIAGPCIDAQLIFLLTRLMDRLRVADIAVHINSLGCPECRPAYREKLLAYMAGRMDHLCDDCRRRSDVNPLRALDCKSGHCQKAMADAPEQIDFLCKACADHFAAVRASIADLGVSYTVDKRLVRGLDYYSRTTFEILTGAMGGRIAVAGGGRYDGLIKLLGGPDTPGIGFAIGEERLVEICGRAAEEFSARPHLYIAALGEDCFRQAFSWLCRLNEAGIRVETDMSGRSLKSQMKRAGRLNAPHVLIFGENERTEGRAILRDMTTKTQESLPLDGLVPELIRRMSDTG